MTTDRLFTKADLDEVVRRERAAIHSEIASRAGEIAHFDDTETACEELLDVAADVLNRRGYEVPGASMFRAGDATVAAQLAEALNVAPEVVHAGLILDAPAAVGRNAELSKVAARYLRGGLTLESARAKTHEANAELEVPLPADEVEAIVDSLAGYDDFMHSTKFGIDEGVGPEEFKRAMGAKVPVKSVEELENRVALLVQQRDQLTQRLNAERARELPEPAEGVDRTKLLEQHAPDLPDEYLVEVLKQATIAQEEIQRRAIASHAGRVGLKVGLEASDPPLFVGPAGHVYTVGDIRHAVAALAAGGVDVDKPFEGQIELFERSLSPALRLIATDYKRRERDRSKLAGAAPWPERVAPVMSCPECSGRTPRGEACGTCDGSTSVAYVPTSAAMSRAFMIHLRGLSFVAQRAAGIFRTSGQMLPKGKDGERGPQAEAYAVAASVFDLVAHLANVSTLPFPVDAGQLVATYRRLLAEGLGQIANLIQESRALANPRKATTH